MGRNASAAVGDPSRTPVEINRSEQGWRQAFAVQSRWEQRWPYPEAAGQARKQTPSIRSVIGWRRQVMSTPLQQSHLISNYEGTPPSAVTVSQRAVTGHAGNRTERVSVGSHDSEDVPLAWLP